MYVLEQKMYNPVNPSFTEVEVAGVKINVCITSVTEGEIAGVKLV